MCNEQIFFFFYQLQYVYSMGGSENKSRKHKDQHIKAN